MKNIVVLGATGNLGIQTLEVLKSYTKSLEVFGLSGFKNKKLLNELAKNFSTRLLAKAPKNAPLSSRRPLVATTPAEILALSTHKNADIVINLISGIAGLRPTLAGLKADKIVILANKESLFLEGEKIMKLARLGENLIPLDSEHNAIFEILKFAARLPGRREVPKNDAIQGNKKLATETYAVVRRGESDEVDAELSVFRHFPPIDKIILTGTGGAFFGKTAKELKALTAKDAFKNSVWNMGKKITIESATLINKGLEIIEAYHLFNVPLKNITVKIDKTANLHAIVKFKTGKMLGYFSPPDMRHYIENALNTALETSANTFRDSAYFAKKTSTETSPRMSFSTPGPIREVSKKELAALASPDYKTFPGIKIVLCAYAKNKKSSPASLRLAFLKKEEKAVADFIDGKITFPEIFKKLKSSPSAHFAAEIC